MEIRQNYPLKNFNTFHLDVSSAYFVEVHSVEELQLLLTDKNLVSIPKFILGGGSNILFTKNFDGLVISNNLKGIQKLDDDGDFIRINQEPAKSGMTW